MPSPSPSPRKCEPTFPVDHGAAPQRIPGIPPHELARRQTAGIIQTSIISSDSAAREHLREFVKQTPGLALTGLFPSPEAAEGSLAETPNGVGIVHDAAPRSIPRMVGKLKFLVKRAALVAYAAALDAAEIFSCLEQGACACVFASAPPGQFERAISEAGQNRVFLCRQAEWQVVQRLATLAAAVGKRPLTEEQVRTCLWLCNRPEGDVARARPDTIDVVHSHVKAIYKHLGVHSRDQLIELLRRPVQSPLDGVAERPRHQC